MMYLCGFGYGSLDWLSARVVKAAKSRQLFSYRVYKDRTRQNKQKLMKPITDYSKLPKFLVISDNQAQKSSNKYLLKPYRKGEIVRVAPAEEQKPNHEFDQMTTRVKPCTDEFWKEHYLKILRKGGDGKFSLPYVISWGGVELLKKAL